MEVSKLKRMANSISSLLKLSSILPRPFHTMFPNVERKKANKTKVIRPIDILKMVLLIFIYYID